MTILPLVLIAAAQAAKLPVPKANVRSVVIARGIYDFDQDGKPDELLLTFVAGRRESDPASGCCLGDRYQGDFAFVVTLSSGRSVTQSLNELLGDTKGSTYLPAAGDPWEITFADYSHDGRAGFALGWCAGCAATAYRFFAVSRDGAVCRLPLRLNRSSEEILVEGVVMNNGFELTRSGFRYRYLAAQVSKRVEGECAWLQALQRFECVEKETGTRNAEGEADAP